MENLGMKINSTSKILILVSIVVIFSGLMFAPSEADAKKSVGTYLTEIGSKKICGDKLCDTSQSIQDKIAAFLEKTRSDKVTSDQKLDRFTPSVLQQGISGTGIPIFSTGVDDSGTLLPLGSVDPHFVVVETGNSAVVLNPASGAWLPNDSTSQWIWLTSDYSQNINAVWTFRTTFDLTGFDPSTVQIDGLVAVDNGLDGIKLNGISVSSPSPSFTSFNPFTIASGFQQGVNTLDFIARDWGVIAGFNAQLSATAETTSTCSTPDRTKDGISGPQRSSKDVGFFTFYDPDSNFGIDQKISPGEKTSFRIFTYVDQDAIDNPKLIIGSEGLDLYETSDVSLNGNFVGKLTNQTKVTTFEITEKSWINWKTGENPAGTNVVEVSFPQNKCNTGDNLVDEIEYGEITAEQRPLVFLPGVGGTHLMNDVDTNGVNGIEWIDLNQYATLIGTLDYIDDLALNKQGTGPAKGKWKIYPGEIIRYAKGLPEIKATEGYATYLDFLASKGYYSEKTIVKQREQVEEFVKVTLNPDSNIRLYEFPYDWRKDNTIHAQELENLVDIITEPVDGWDKVILTAHSMGGLVSKKYISDTNGDQIEFLFTMGTPYYGAVKPYKFFKEGDDFGIPTLEEETINHLVQNWPSAYQLLVTQKYIDEIENTPYTVEKVPYKLFEFDAGKNIGVIYNQPLSLEEAYLTNPNAKLPNSNLMKKAFQFHDSIGDGFGSIENVYIAIGEGQETMTGITITGSKDSPEYEYTYDNRGDGTVPFFSANAGLEGDENIERKTFTDSHAALPNNSGVEEWLWSKIIALNNN